MRGVELIGSFIKRVLVPTVEQTECLVPDNHFENVVDYRVGETSPVDRAANSIVRALEPGELPDLKLMLLA